MKKVIPFVFALSLLVTPYAVYAQQATTVNTVTATETVGTISELGPDALVIHSGNQFISDELHLHEEHDLC